ncbi:hypothetical protein STEG23_000035 [Scotinomys teguina]
MEVKAAAPRCQLLLILLMSAVMLLPGTNGSLLLVQRTLTRTFELQESIGKDTGTVFVNEYEKQKLVVLHMEPGHGAVICGDGAHWFLFWTLFALFSFPFFGSFALYNI